MIRFGEISTKRSGMHFDTFSSDKNRTKNPKSIMNPPPLPSKQTPLFANNFVFEPMPDAGNPMVILESLLKRPGRVLHELHQRRGGILASWLLLFAILGAAIYGVVVGAQSGGAQLWIA